MTVMGVCFTTQKTFTIQCFCSYFFLFPALLLRLKNLSRNFSNLFLSFYRHPTFFWEALSRAYGYSQYHNFILRKTLNPSA